MSRAVPQTNTKDEYPVASYPMSDNPTDRYPVIRLLYSFAVVIYSILGIMNFSYWIHCFSTLPQLLLAYLIFRFVLGLMQLPVHACILLPARYLPEAGQRLRDLLDKNPERSTEKYYTYINYCNVAMFGCIVFGIMTLATITEQHTAFYLTTECISICILLTVLTARIYAVITNQVKQMFYLA